MVVSEMCKRFGLKIHADTAVIFPKSWNIFVNNRILF